MKFILPPTKFRNRETYSLMPFSVVKSNALSNSVDFGIALVRDSDMALAIFS